MSKTHSHKVSQSKYLKKIYTPSRYKSPLKRSLSGYEIELTLVDEKGDVSNKSQKIIDSCKKLDKNFHVSKEVGKNMVEIVALPDTKIQKTALFLLDNLQTVQIICMDKGLSLLPLGTYPGVFKEKTWKKKRYIYPANAINPEKY